VTNQYFKNYYETKTSFTILKEKIVMSTTEIQESIIQKIRHTNNDEQLNYLNQLLSFCIFIQLHLNAFQNNGFGDG